MNRELKLIVWVFIFSLFTKTYSQNTVQHVVENRQNSDIQKKKPYVIFISADGFRYDYADKYDAKNLISLRDNGVKAVSMKPSYPTMTFSNLYTLATGLYPSHHGLVNNTFYDPQHNKIYSRHNPGVLKDSSWYDGVPIWVLAEEQKMLSATFYWVGSETAINGVRPSYWYDYSTAISLGTRIETVKQWLLLPDEKRPHLIAFYFPEVDFAAHTYGTYSDEVVKAVQLVDRAIGKMVEMTNQFNLEINYVFVSDHGMMDVDTENYIGLPKAVSGNNFIVPNSDALLQVYARDKSQLEITYQQLKQEAKDYQVYRAEETPKEWYFRASDNKDGRIGDFVLVPNLPKVFNISGKKLTKGKHGFDNRIPEMQAVFYAWGPAFKQGLNIPSFENVHIYPLLAKILGLSYQHQIDGDIRVLQPILKE